VAIGVIQERRKGWTEWKKKDGKTLDEWKRRSGENSE